MPGSSSLVRQQLVIATVAAFLLLSAAKGHCSLDAKWITKTLSSCASLGQTCAGVAVYRAEKTAPGINQRPSVKSNRRACCPYRLAPTWMGKSLYQMNPIGPVNTFST
jgi:hypothetical protein